MAGYQHTAKASKGNAFCWESWTATIAWDQRSERQSAAQTAVVEAKRAEGVDLAYLPGIGSSAQRDATSIARHAIRTAKETANAR